MGAFTLDTDDGSISYNEHPTPDEVKFVTIIVVSLIIGAVLIISLCIFCCTSCCRKSRGGVVHHVPAAMVAVNSYPGGGTAAGIPYALHHNPAGAYNPTNTGAPGSITCTTAPLLQYIDGERSGYKQ